MLAKQGKEPEAGEERSAKGVLPFTYFHLLDLWSRFLFLQVLVQVPTLAEEELED